MCTSLLISALSDITSSAWHRTLQERVGYRNCQALLQSGLSPSPREAVIKYLSAQHWIEGRCDKYQMNSQATSTREHEKKQRSHGAGVDRRDFVKVVGTEMDHKAWVDLYRKKVICLEENKRACLEVEQDEAALGTVRGQNTFRRRILDTEVFLWKFDFRSLGFHTMGFHRKVHTCSVGPYIRQTFCMGH